MKHFHTHRPRLAVLGALTLVGIAFFFASGGDFAMTPGELVISIIALIVGAGTFAVGLALLDLGSFREQVADEATYAEIAQARMETRREQAQRLVNEARTKALPYAKRALEAASARFAALKERIKLFRTPVAE